jgi:hypothetical protein
LCCNCAFTVLAGRVVDMTICSCSMSTGSCNNIELQLAARLTPLQRCGCTGWLAGSLRLLLTRIVEKGVMARYDGDIKGRFWRDCRMLAATTLTRQSLIPPAAAAAPVRLC